GRASALWCSAMRELSSDRGVRNATEDVPYRAIVGIPQQGIWRNVFDEAGAKEGIVRGVFEEAADEIGHAWDELAVGHIDREALAAANKSIFFGVSHAVQHLDFERRLGQLQNLRGCNSKASERMLCDPSAGWRWPVLRSKKRVQRSKLA